MKKFDIPTFYRSSFISSVKETRKVRDPRKKDFTPTVLDFGPVQFLIARHFGFCYGVENAIEISYKAIEENPDKRIFLLSQMIHNPSVNSDLEARGLRFIQDTQGNTITPWEELRSDDIVIIPAFGTTLEIEQQLANMGIETKPYNTTCPFVEKVWKTSAKLGSADYSIIIHGKHKHEETRATFSHSQSNAPSVVIANIEEARLIGAIIRGERPSTDFYSLFAGRYSEGFDAEKHLDRLGVVNQTTMLASDTHEIAEYVKQQMLDKYGPENLKDHFSDTRDTLCYATNDNQEATYGLLKQSADLAVVVGGYNSSNTSHLVELCEEKFPTYFIAAAEEIKSESEIHHFDYPNKQMLQTRDFLPTKREKVSIVLTSGASCPDAQVDEVLDRLLAFFPNCKSKEAVLAEMQGM